ncbi:hypothetical protein Q066_02662 [Pseudomonas aeruginosa BL12]|uniref:DUF1329 domain-containing protein n=1 Tax=Pseudomonas aeruginosa TaxID=287 RepID=UPI0003B9C291|nr:DUF1329 domain-containing protein [Pseudomonas aeruginosa]EKV0191586.1 DUF1329 domain-containing protein [Pseudomonas aeruginosa]EKX5092193.1 DUF1329 domain-containing protein [Pseudomonas aeruginosa]EME9705133.1 DUF1329 domain-containing protein [Pseudomonas aeruginosa]ERY38023.1 hypothetical protein Q066_02662 [Pseudomonas aeruginosa BL12]MBV6214353.1 DUF1329 domain-containing protein [Pseudomonas aeruginosa]
MKNLQFSLLGGALLALLGTSHLQAATSPDLSKLGSELTPIGAEKAGNADGSIPAWSGGLIQAPAGWSRGKGDPYASEKPLYSIDASNVAKYQNSLPEGQVALIKTYPGYRLDVYPTHRSCAIPSEVAERSKAYAGQARIGSDGWRLEQAVGAAVPFPVPQSGIEVMWNYKLRYMAKGRRAQVSILLREKGGALTEIRQWAYEYYPYNDAAVRDPSDTGGIEAKLLSDVLSPSSRAGEMYLVHSFLDKAQSSWIYFPGQRRVRLAPSFAYDNPIAGTDNLYFVDQINMFTGALDRYDFKLVGKKEMLVPYNSYKLVDKSNKYEQLIGQDYLNRDVQRYEKHRVWVVEATVKADKRHSFAKRVFFFDEDSWSLLHVDMYDAKGNLWRVQEGSLWADPEIQACTSFEYVSYDLIARRYIADGFTQEGLSLDLGAGLQGRVSDKMFNSNELRRRGER